MGRADGDGLESQGNQLGIEEIKYKGSEVSLLRVFFQRAWQRLASGLRWVWKQYAYLCEITTAVILILGAIVILGDAVTYPHSLIRWEQWISTFVWAIVPTYRLPAQSLPPTLFWDMFVFPASLVVLPWIAVALVRNARLEMTAWKYAPEQRLAYAIQKNRTFLSYLYVVAQFENMPRQYWRQLKAADEGDLLFSPFARVPISRSAGPFSYAYVTLSTYLSLSPWVPEGNIVEGTLVEAAPEPEPVIEHQTTNPHVPLSHAVKIEIFLFGKVRIRVVGIDGREWIIEKPRLAELLAYIAMHTREQPISSDTVVTYVYDQEESRGKNAQQLYYLLNNDVGELRDFFKGVFEEVGLEYKNPITTHGRGKKARRSLSGSYVIVDVVRLETAVKTLAEAKQGGLVELQMVRETSELAFQSYGGTFLEQLRNEGYAASWAQNYYEDYQVMYHQLLWDMAEYEHEQAENTTAEAQRDGFKRSAQLYRDYAVVTMPGLTSERALQHSMTIAGKMGERQLADRAYCEYVETLKRSFHRKLTDPHTTRVWEEVIGKQPGTVV